jgi:hypothetical protein
MRVHCISLSGMGGPTSSYVAAGIALEFVGAHKPPHQQQSSFHKVEVPSRGPHLIATILNYFSAFHVFIISFSHNHNHCYWHMYGQL